MGIEATMAINLERKANIENCLAKHLKKLNEKEKQPIFIKALSDKEVGFVGLYRSVSWDQYDKESLRVYVWDFQRVEKDDKRFRLDKGSHPTFGIKLHFRDSLYVGGDVNKALEKYGVQYQPDMSSVVYPELDLSDL